MICFVFYNKGKQERSFSINPLNNYCMSRTLKIQLEMMVRFPTGGKTEIINQFKGTKQTSLEKTLQDFIQKMIPEEYCPRKSFPFLFIYKIGKLQVGFVFFNGWRLQGKYDPKKGELVDLTEEDKIYLQKIVNGEN